MQFCKSFLGAVVGAAVGVGVLLALYMVLHIDKVWLAIPFAIVTGLGVRACGGTAGRASYVRGAMTMLIALAGYIGGWWLVAQVASAQANSAGKRGSAASEKDSGDAVKSDAAGDKARETDGKGDQAIPSMEDMMAKDLGAHSGRGMSPSGFGSPLDMIWLGIAALVAYEMGRGSGKGGSGDQPSADSKSAGGPTDA